MWSAKVYFAIVFSASILIGPCMADTEAASMRDDAPILSALEQCLNSGMGTVPPVSHPKLIPPGLSHGSNVNVTALDGMGERVFLFRGTEPGVMSCGVAMYGPVPDHTRLAIVQKIEDLHRWKPFSPDYWNRTAAPAIKTYWGSSLAAGLNGVLMMTREPSLNAPTLEVEYHSMLVQ